MVDKAEMDRREAGLLLVASQDEYIRAQTRAAEAGHQAVEWITDDMDPTEMSWDFGPGWRNW